MAFQAWGVLSAGASPAPDVEDFLRSHYRQRVAALVAGEPELIPTGQFDQTTGTGRWLAAREKAKIEHLHSWLRGRGYQLVDHQLEVKVLRSRVEGTTAVASVIVRLGLAYRAGNQPDPPTHWLGVGTSHVVNLVRQGEGWLVRKDYALDPLYEQGPPPGVEGAPALHSPPAAAAAMTATPGTGGALAAGRRSFDRTKAAEYSDRYCGIAWGCGNGHRYNRQFRDFTGLGGDCANFASQTLIAGGLRPGGSWLYDARSRTASAAWVNAGALVRHLVYSGKGTLLARGSFERVTAAAGGPGLEKLAPGDIIGYEREGDIVHVSVVSGSDPHGYTVVNSHTADRYHVPWDLGWGANTRFWVVRIRG